MEGKYSGSMVRPAQALLQIEIRCSAVNVWWIFPTCFDGRRVKNVLFPIFFTWLPVLGATSSSQELLPFNRIAFRLGLDVVDNVWALLHRLASAIVCIAEELLGGG